jgi:hypothetical protein
MVIAVVAPESFNMIRRVWTFHADTKRVMT